MSLPEVEFLDPMDRDYRGREHESPRTLVEEDKRDIRKADAIFVNAWKTSVGTSMEVLYAHMIGVPVVLLNRGNLSPWLVAHADSHPPTMADAVVALRQLAARIEKGCVR